MQDFKIKWGTTLPFFITGNTDNAASTATLTIQKTDGSFTHSKSGTFVDGGVDVSFNTDETEIALGDYYYQLRIDYVTGQVDKFPNQDLSNCCGDNDDATMQFPKVTITEALDEPGVVS